MTEGTGNFQDYYSKIDYKVYKTRSAAQFSFSTPRMKNGKPRPGKFFITAANAISKNSYDWDNKIQVAINVDECGKVIRCLTKGESQDFFHDPNKKRIAGKGIQPSGVSKS